jgi:glycosyltransferase involved in cell wall biosynthesis
MTAIRHIVYECVPGAYAGGVQKMVYELASAQRQLGADVEVWAPDAIRAGSTEDFDGLPIRYFMPGAGLGLAQSYRLEQAIAELPRASVLHAHATYHPLNLQVGRAARRCGHRTFYHPHGALSPVWLRGWGWKALKKRLYIAAFERPNLNAATGLFALTEDEQRDLVELGVTAPTHVVPNGIAPFFVGDDASARSFRGKHAIPEGARVMLFVGRIVALKRIEDIAEVLALLRLNHPDLHLVIAGDLGTAPAYVARLREQFTASGIADRVRWVGFLDEQAKPAAYAAAQVFVHASESEGMAIAILEAMAAGVPVVASRQCHMSAAAEAGALKQCEQGPIALAEAIAEVLVAPAALGVRGQAYVRRVHAWSAIAAETLKIYAKGASRA